MSRIAADFRSTAAAMPGFAQCDDAASWCAEPGERGCWLRVGVG
ncbi:hypothetical protein AB0N46_14070 [Streptomyces albidoflavus]